MENIYYNLTFLIQQQEYEAVLTILYDCSYIGAQEEITDDTIKIISSFDSAYNAQKAIKKLTALSPDLQITHTVIKNEDWNSEWKKTMKPAKITKHIWASPTWLPPKLQKNDIWIKIEPKMVFGSGHHETTRLAAQMILNNYNEQNQCLLDVGAGSGILSFIANTVGFEHTIGLEIDIQSLENLVENLKDNPSKNYLHFIIGNINSISKTNYFNTIVMNMIRTHSEPLLPKIYALLKKNGLLIWSGILKNEYQKVITQARFLNFNLVEENSENEWWCGVFKKI